MRWHPSGLPPWQRRLPAALAARGRLRFRRQEPLQLEAIPLARMELVGWPAAWRPKIAAPLTFASAFLVFHTVYLSCAPTQDVRVAKTAQRPGTTTSGASRLGWLQLVTPTRRLAGREITTSRTTLSQPRTSWRARSLSFALLIPLRPCDDREKKPATYGHDMNDDYLIGRRCRVPGVLD